MPPQPDETWSSIQGSSVRVLEGPFHDFVGVVQEMDVDQGKVRVVLSFFGRETPVELNFDQVERLYPPNR